MKIKKILPNEPFNLNGTIYEYIIGSKGEMILKRLKTAPKASKQEFIPPTLADTLERNAIYTHNI